VAIDHLILGIDNLQRGIEDFARLTGVKPEFGGEHPGRGTANALVSLGAGRYLEILAPATADSKVYREWSTIVGHKTLTPVGWVLQARDLTRVIAQLRAAGIGAAGPYPGSRQRPDGTLLSWKTAGVSADVIGLLPFFIEWDKGSAHPSTTSPRGCELVRLAITAPQPEALQKLLATVAVSVPVTVGSTEGITFTLRCAKGEVTFPAPEAAVPKE
jgi:hypothetical protein